MGDKTWKRVEREACRELGGERRGPTGRDLPDCDDAVKVGLEIKAYKRLVVLTKDWQQAVENAEQLGLIPVLYVREGGRNGRDVVQLYSAHWLLLDQGIDPTGLKVEAGPTTRISWAEFVLLYHYTFRKEIA